MKKEITEYEQTSETNSYIKCENCDKTWEKREPWVKGKEDIHILALDMRVEESGPYRNYESGFGRRLHERDSYVFHAEAHADYCEECYGDLFEQVATNMKVTEEEFVVEEKTRTEYVCDFCHDEMGDSVEHSITVNPYLVSVMSQGSVGTRRNTETEKDFPGFNNSFMVPRCVRTKAQREKSLDCCQVCAIDIFELDVPKNQPHKGGDSGFLARLFGL